MSDLFSALLTPSGSMFLMVAFCVCCLGHGGCVLAVDHAPLPFVRLLVRAGDVLFLVAVACAAAAFGMLCGIGMEMLR